MQMKTLQPTIAVLFALGLMASTANATVIVDDPNNPGNACGIPCDFNFGTFDLSNVSIPTITSNSIGDDSDRVIKNFGTLESAVFEGTIGNVGTFSLFETITNNSVGTPPAFGGGGEWDQFTVAIEFFGIDVGNGDSIDWSQVSATGAITSPATVTDFGTSAPTFAFDFDFGSPLGFGESFSLGIFFTTDIDTDVDFRITQTPTAATSSTPMPEPTTLALLGLGLAGLGASRRKKA